MYRDLIVGEAEAAPTVTAAPSATAGTSTIDPATLSGTWAVTDGSYAGYRVDEVLNSTDVTVVGRTEEDRPLGRASRSPPRTSPSTSRRSPRTRGSRDDYFRDIALRVYESPRPTFTLTGPVTTAATPVVGEVQALTATGDLTIAGVPDP